MKVIELPAWAKGGRQEKKEREAVVLSEGCAVSYSGRGWIIVQHYYSLEGHEFTSWPDRGTHTHWWSHGHPSPDIYCLPPVFKHTT